MKLNTHPPEISSHQDYDPNALRVLPPKKYVQALPKKLITSEEFGMIICTWEFNPSYYCEGLPKSIVGYDLNYRYQLKD